MRVGTAAWSGARRILPRFRWGDHFYSLWSIRINMDISLSDAARNNRQYESIPYNSITIRPADRKQQNMPISRIEGHFYTAIHKINHFAALKKAWIQGFVASGDGSDGLSLISSFVYAAPADPLPGSAGWSANVHRNPTLCAQSCAPTTRSPS